MSERLELVTDFAKLKAGDLVVLTPLTCGHERHRGILLDFIPNAAGLTNIGQIQFADGWKVSDDCDGFAVGIRPITVAQGRVYLVATGLESDKAETTEKSLERVQ